MLAQKRDLEYPIDDNSLLRKILSPYIPTGTDYLKSSSLTHTWQNETHSENDALIQMTGSFSIPTSCYIEATGHFNAVEFLICYNQLAYSLFGVMVNDRYFKDPKFKLVSPRCWEPLASVSIESYLKNQISSMLILKSSTRFKRVIDAGDFTATLSINKFNFRNNTIFIDTSCIFNDANGGKADGNVLLAYPFNFSHQSLKQAEV